MDNTYNIPPLALMREITSRWSTCWRDMRTMRTDKSLAYLSIPDWCVMPVMMGASAYVLTGRAITEQDLTPLMPWLDPAASLYTWRLTKGVYRYDPTLLDALRQQPLDGDLPFDLFARLPAQAVYIETPGMSFDCERMAGYIAHLDYNLETLGRELQFCVFLAGRQYPRMYAIPDGQGSIVDAVQRVINADRKAYLRHNNTIVRPTWTVPDEEAIADLTAMIQLLLYLCSEEPDIPADTQATPPRAGKRTDVAAQDVRVWDVGIRIGSALRKSQDRTQADEDERTHGRPRAHIRRAHWHKYWVGAQGSAERRITIRWLPPIAVNVADDDDNLPVTIRDVKED